MTTTETASQMLQNAVNQVINKNLKQQKNYFTREINSQKDYLEIMESCYNSQKQRIYFWHFGVWTSLGDLKREQNYLRKLIQYREQLNHVTIQ
jgi:hypothetical protein